jgi:hypothetical protein
MVRNLIPVHDSEAVAGKRVPQGYIQVLPIAGNSNLICPVDYWDRIFDLRSFRVDPDNVCSRAGEEPGARSVPNYIVGALRQGKCTDRDGLRVSGPGKSAK